ncbi:MAG: hypothetical protein ABSE15_00280 [Candidatus Bathyarchaeia archaeon]
MKTKLLVCLVIAVGLAVGLGVAFALQSLTWTQNPTVTAGAVNFAVTSGGTAIAAGADQSASWTWNSASDTFTMPISIINSNNAALTPTVTAANVPSGWTFSTSTLSAIVPGGNLPVTLTLTYTGTGAPAAGQIGAFTVTVA